ncbi:Long-chain-fatty-acid--CoA ligase [Pseudonocardia sp. Ae168_Ps1]|uniref:AMP-binding protein n=1 Tax=unclassified Pseudonocardia TaxID=2619320 RepID=UPI00094AE640|nr:MULTISPECIES: AMP-binding protein [unclassified Pseudonocardia]OLL71067.1 Long-chain-fatty-acid--CoA ligase [Pseudonocardia sp. Ae168_Ps1]OLL77383.1 Long-chain-fatty-acid--CoA ligase [Pseudonocardia sp. Ae150A_Ps1]OLL88505.1 Long-chain-fatty-acid--CoA ligase [Pseudonocardia sp. Ae263_Ps1]OLL91472.1 Long-chain-fatty-acid--CoA ligase [Pseudonocardia sp. Ae356_Ps1]
MSAAQGPAYGPTVYDQLARVAAGTPDTPFQVHGDRRWTWAQARDEVDALAGGMQRLGVRRGDTVAIWLPNVGEWTLLWLAAASLGAAAVPVNTRYKADEAAYLVGQSGAVLLVHPGRFLDIDFRAMVDRMPELPALRHVVTLGEPGPGELRYTDLLDPGRDLTGARAAVTPSDDLILVYTSDTTGFPKGARHPHTTLSDVAAMAGVMGVHAGDRILTQFPFFHVGGSFLSTMTVLVTGASMVCVEHFTGEGALEEISRERCTVVNGVPSHFVMMLSAMEAGAAVDTASVRVGFVAGALIPPELVRGIRRHLGMDLLTMYGMTETTGVTTATRLDDPDEVLLGTVGRPIADDYEVAVVDPATAERASTGTDGEIWVRGHRVTPGYHGIADPETFRDDGWFRTGDLGRMRPDGNLMITGRLKDMFIVGGTNTFPAEIENVIGSLDGVVQVHVVGVPDARLGEVGCAYVEVRPGEAPDADAVVAHCRERLAGYKVPRHVFFVDEFPMTATGKIQKYRLRDRAIDDLDLGELAGSTILGYHTGSG